jgi:hypothetical protein
MSRSLFFMSAVVLGACYRANSLLPSDASMSDGPHAIDATRDAFPSSDRRLCLGDLDCREAEECVVFLTEPVAVCARACPRLYRECEDGLICSQIDDDAVSSLGAGYCFPGAESPGPTCSDRFDCGAGQICSELGRFTDGVCSDLTCAGSDQCPSRFLCRNGGCHPVCDEASPAACPSNFVCAAGRCEREGDAASCLRVSSVDRSCPLGQVCHLDATGALLCSAPAAVTSASGCPAGTRRVEIECIPW